MLEKTPKVRLFENEIVRRSTLPPEWRYADERLIRQWMRTELMLLTTFIVDQRMPLRSHMRAFSYIDVTVVDDLDPNIDYTAHDPAKRKFIVGDGGRVDPNAPFCIQQDQHFTKSGIASMQDAETINLGDAERLIETLKKHPAYQEQRRQLKRRAKGR